jgi:uncharacterized protein (TIGR03435 family)
MGLKEMRARGNWRSSAANIVFPCLSLILTSACFAQTAAPAFEVASVKPTTAEPGSSSGISSDIGRITGRNVTLKRCMRGAYGIPEAQIFGGPKWVDEERYDIDAKAPGPAGDHAMMAMLQQLLAERFQLVVHRETRPLPGYALVVGKKGLTAKRSEPGVPSTSNASRRSIEATACNMGCLARKLSEVLHAPVADLTGVEREFDFQLEFTPDDLQAKPASAGDTAAQGPSVFAALDEQLGLKLEARKVPTEVIVIDRAEKATAN